MGCDIHCYIEYKKPDHDGWRDFGGRINPGRNYDLFAALAGARNYNEVKPAADPRGFPSDAAFAASDDYWLYVTDCEGDKYATPAQAEVYASNGCRYKDGGKKFIQHPDWHSHSWLTPDEYAKAIDGFDDELEYRAILAALRSFESDGVQARLVFWFDN